MTQFYGITPPDLDAMTYREISEYITQMDQARASEGRSTDG